jgi:hypothetical protein
MLHNSNSHIACLLDSAVRNNEQINGFVVSDLDLHLSDVAQ